MKQIELTTEQNAILRELMGVAPEGGVDVAGMRRAIRVIDALEAVPSGAVTLDDADFDALRARFTDARFRIVSRTVLDIARVLEV